jgi:chromosome partitioning protein
MNELTPRLTIAQFANLMKVTPQAIHKQLKLKNIHPPKVGKYSFIHHLISREWLQYEYNKQTVAFHIVKGGTGKTTTVHNCAACLNALGAKVLLIDIDPQANLTTAFNILSYKKPVLIDIFREGIPLTEAIVEISPGLDILPSSITNVVIDNLLSVESWPLEKIFPKLLKDVKDIYDFILIDCPPAIGNIVTSAYLGSDKVIAVLAPDKFSAQGLDILHNEIQNIKEKYDREVLYNIFLNKYKSNTVLSEKAITSIYSSNKYSNKTLESAIRFAQDIANYADQNKHLFTNLTSYPVKNDYLSLTMELFNINLIDK